MKNNYIEFAEKFKHRHAINPLKVVDPRGLFAMDIISRLALIAAEIVSFACDVADRAFSTFEINGWILNLPDHTDTPKVSSED